MQLLKIDMANTLTPFRSQSGKFLLNRRFPFFDFNFEECARFRPSAAHTDRPTLARDLLVLAQKYFVLNNFPDLFFTHLSFRAGAAAGRG